MLVGVLTVEEHAQAREGGNGDNGDVGFMLAESE